MTNFDHQAAQPSPKIDLPQSWQQTRVRATSSDFWTIAEIVIYYAPDGPAGYETSNCHKARPGPANVEL